MSVMQNKNYYEILGLQINCEQSDIKRAYFRLAKMHHPDVNKSSDAEETFKKIYEAYQVLYDKTKRRLYDYSLKNNTTFSGGGSTTSFNVTPTTNVSKNSYQYNSHNNTHSTNNSWNQKSYTNNYYSSNSNKQSRTWENTTKVKFDHDDPNVENVNSFYDNYQQNQKENVTYKTSKVKNNNFSNTQKFNKNDDFSEDIFNDYINDLVPWDEIEKLLINCSNQKRLSCYKHFWKILWSNLDSVEKIFLDKKSSKLIKYFSISLAYVAKIKEYDENDVRNFLDIISTINYNIDNIMSNSENYSEELFLYCHKIIESEFFIDEKYAFISLVYSEQTIKLIEKIEEIFIEEYNNQILKSKSKILAIIKDPRVVSISVFLLIIGAALWIFL